MNNITTILVDCRVHTLFDGASSYLKQSPLTLCLGGRITSPYHSRVRLLLTVKQA